MQIRRARAEESELLTRVAQEAKAHWGYAPEVLASWRAELSVSPDSVAAMPTFVAEVDGHVAGFFQLSGGAEVAELEHFWVLPGDMGRGIGRALLARAAASCAALGHRELHIDADPHAERFYLACGAVRTGARPAPIAGQPQRVRPQLVLRTRLKQGPPG